jgi:hypothetical protein
VALNLQTIIHFPREMKMLIFTWGQVFLIHKSVIPVIKRVEFVSGRMLY